ncbi:hypothetical protein FISHEDRAFT_73708 [Fistulina hepatica ATCC 64428]|uniref:Uncharacterized protein n=1 Tax=Fistulina hepatica ATCC 64428 TaxID=1128425 RepID=A0A0D7ABL3_9AGAR|nr:hypothetical protein FISHEDRAFT_73708 [Fistulina hepatica ATCC 64428]
MADHPDRYTCGALPPLGAFSTPSPLSCGLLSVWRSSRSRMLEFGSGNGGHGAGIFVHYCTSAGTK